jgi:hypothetical protein
MAIATLKYTNKVWGETHVVAYDDNVYGDTPEGAELFVSNLLDAINKARHMTMHVGTYVVLYVKTTHHEWEVTISKSKSSDSTGPGNTFPVMELETGRQFLMTRSFLGDDWLNQFWTLQTG